MNNAVIPDEKERLSLLHAYRLLDTPPDPLYDELTRLAAQICETQFAGISFMDTERAWLKSSFGIPFPELPREGSYCGYTLQHRCTLLFEDAQHDPRCTFGPIQLGGIPVRFFAGVPIELRNGIALGALFVADFEPRSLAPERLRDLEALTRQVVTQVELRLAEARLKESEALARIGSWEEELTTRQLIWSDQLFEILDFPKDAGPPSVEAFVARIHPDDLTQAWEAFRRVVQGQSDPGLDLRYLWRDGQVRWLHCRQQVLLDSKGRPVKIIGSTLDITERKEYEEALRRSEERFQISQQRLEFTLNRARLGTFVRDLSTGIYSDVSPTWREQFGLGNEPPGTFDAFLSRIHPDDRNLVRTTVYEAVADNQGYDTEYRVQLSDGMMRWIRASATPIYDSQGQITCISGVTQDITEQKAIEAERERALFEAQERADRDPLTNLLNHRAFHKRLQEETERALREGSRLAVVMLDTDNFKFFNDVYGHAIGDEVLQLIARRLEEVLRPYDILARFGGDEFALLLPGVESGAEVVEERLLHSLEGLVYQPEGQCIRVPLTLSSGIALFPDHTNDRTALIPLADEQLRQAKSGADHKTEAYRARTRFKSQVEGFSMLDALVTAVDNKDRYTRRHSEDVMAYCLQIARQLGLDDATQHTLAVAALLHDVGKIGVPDFILRKPGKLTDEEFDAVKQHAAMGAAIVSAVPGLEDTLDCVRHHHERWDGKGYPAGLAGESVPYLARLMAVADAYSAMTTDRPYRQGMPAERALQILREGAGSQWDAQMVEAFLQARAARELSAGSAPPRTRRS